MAYMFVPEHITVFPPSPTSTTPPRYQCNYCKRSFKSRGNINYHSFCKGGDKPFKCDICGYDFITRPQLKNHMKVHLSERKVTYPCPVCTKVFSQKQSIERHLITHSTGYRFYCKKCDFEFRSRDGLKKHNRTKHGKKNFKCESCDREFGTQAALRKHSMIHRKKDLPLKCKVCEHCFPTESARKTHEVMHKEEKCFHKCDECGRVFDTPKDLERHVRSHTGEKPYACPLCCVAVSRKDNLQRHLIAIHATSKDETKRISNEVETEYRKKVKLSKEAALKSGTNSSSSLTSQSTTSRTSGTKSKKSKPKRSNSQTPPTSSPQSLPPPVPEPNTVSNYETKLGSEIPSTSKTNLSQIISTEFNPNSQLSIDSLPSASLSDEIILDSQLPELVLNAPEIALNTPEVVISTSEIVLNTPELVLNTPEIVLNTQPVVGNQTEALQLEPCFYLMMQVDDLAQFQSDENQYAYVLLADTDEQLLQTDQPFIPIENLSIPNIAHSSASCAQCEQGNVVSKPKREDEDGYVLQIKAVEPESTEAKSENESENEDKCVESSTVEAS